MVHASSYSVVSLRYQLDAGGSSCFQHASSAGCTTACEGAGWMPASTAQLSACAVDQESKGVSQRRTVRLSHRSSSFRVNAGLQQRQRLAPTQLRLSASTSVSRSSTSKCSVPSEVVKYLGATGSRSIGHSILLALVTPCLLPVRQSFAGWTLKRSGVR
jgi:hypothetical protein